MSSLNNHKFYSVKVSKDPAEIKKTIKMIHTTFSKIAKSNPAYEKNLFMDLFDHKRISTRSIKRLLQTTNYLAADDYTEMRFYDEGENNRLVLFQDYDANGNVCHYRPEDTPFITIKSTLVYNTATGEYVSFEIKKEEDF